MNKETCKLRAAVTKNWRLKELVTSRKRTSFYPFVYCLWTMLILFSWFFFTFLFLDFSLLHFVITIEFENRSSFENIESVPIVHALSDNETSTLISCFNILTAFTHAWNSIPYIVWPWNCPITQVCFKFEFFKINNIMKWLWHPTFQSYVVQARMCCTWHLTFMRHTSDLEP